MRRRPVDLWYQSSFGRSRSVETSRNSSLSSQHSWLAVEPGAQRGRSSLRYLPLFDYIIRDFKNKSALCHTMKQCPDVVTGCSWSCGGEEASTIFRNSSQFPQIKSCHQQQQGVAQINNPAGFDLGFNSNVSGDHNEHVDGVCRVFWGFLGGL